MWAPAPFTHGDCTTIPQTKVMYKYFPNQIVTISNKQYPDIPEIIQNMVNIVQKLIHYILTLILLICSIAYIIPAFGV